MMFRTIVFSALALLFSHSSSAAFTPGQSGGFGEIELFSLEKAAPSTANCEKFLLNEKLQSENADYLNFASLLKESVQNPDKLAQAQALFQQKAGAWFPELFRQDSPYSKYEGAIRMYPSLMISSSGKIRGLFFPTPTSFIMFFRSPKAIEYFNAFGMDSIGIAAPRGGKESELLPELSEVFTILGEQTQINSLMIAGKNPKKGNSIFHYLSLNGTLEFYGAALKASPLFTGKIENLDLRMVSLMSELDFFPNVKSLFVYGSQFSDAAHKTMLEIPNLIDVELKASYSHSQLRKIMDEGRNTPLPMSSKLRGVLQQGQVIYEDKTPPKKPDGESN